MSKFRIFLHNLKVSIREKLELFFTRMIIASKKRENQLKAIIAVLVALVTAQFLSGLSVTLVFTVGLCAAMVVIFAVFLLFMLSGLL